MDMCIYHTIRDYEDSIGWKFSQAEEFFIQNNHRIAKFLNGDDMSHTTPVYFYFKWRSVLSSFVKLFRRFDHQNHKYYSTSNSNMSYFIV